MLSRRLLFALCLCLTTPALADDPPAWRAAGAVASATDDDVRKSGLQGIGPHVPDLEKALADGTADFPPKPGADGKAIVLVDGPTESLLAMMAAAKDGKGSIAIANPYAEIGLLLTLYYNEIHRPEDALRVSDITLKLKPVQGAFVGTRDASLLTERATAYQALKRWEEGLATDDMALKASQNDRDKARSHRGRGFFLTELGRLDDAVTAYQESLKLEPNNTVARNELAYIARLKAGGPTAPSTQFIPKPGAGVPPAQ